MILHFANNSRSRHRLARCRFLQLIIASLLIVGNNAAISQATVDLTNFTAFQPPAPNWHLIGDARADLDRANVLVTSPGTGILLNQPEEGKAKQDILTVTQYGDLDLEVDYMMAKGSNSGIYLQGRYEIQLLDSWSVLVPRSSDNGGIYERWNDARPDGQKGYEGHPPRQNVSRAPGLWQHIKISFQAPRFDAGGKKIENARILRVELNGVSIQENVELSGPTRGAVQDNEVAAGPLRLQGDHGPVAFRHLVITGYDKPRPGLIDLKYAVYKGKFETEADLKKLPPDAQGPSVILSSNVSNVDNDFLIRYTGTLRVREAGEYQFNLNTPGGRGWMTIDERMVIESGKGRGKTTLRAGDLPFALVYNKIFDYAKPALGLAVAGPGVREYLISDANVAPGESVDPILITAPVNTVLRSFMDIDTVRVTHGVSVGSPQQVHYTYDLDKGMIVQVWRGGFLDATPMWHSRGDGSSRPAGSVIRFGKPVMALQILSDPGAAWSSDTAGTGYRPKGYKLDSNDRPTFLYRIYNTNVEDISTVMDRNEGIHRQINIENPPAGLYLKLADARTIESPVEGLYLLDDKLYYIRLDTGSTVKPVIRERNGRKELLIPATKQTGYSILF